MKQRKGDWIETFSGIQFYPLDPRPEEICIEDIAHALSNLCRFGGHCKEFYSVAQHSISVSQVCDPGDAFWGLMHDASEAYLIDIPRPIKHSAGFSAAYLEAETRVMNAICERFAMKWEMPESVKRADEILLATEARDIMGAKCAWRHRDNPLDEKIIAMPPIYAKSAFLRQYEVLDRKRF